MGLVKAKRPTETSDQEENRRRRFRGPGGLLEQLADPRAVSRRWAVRDLLAFPEAVGPLLEQLPIETDESVQEVILTGLLTIGGEAVVEGLIPHLRSENAALRNGVIEALQQLPQSVATHIEALLRDTDSDVRIFAVDVLRELAHPQTPVWLAAILGQETEINVCAAAIDCLAEVGSPEVIPTLKATLARFPDQSFLKFSVDMAIARIEDND